MGGIAVEEDINLLAQKLLVSDWYKMDYELLIQLIKEASRYAKEIIDMANGKTTPTKQTRW